MNNIFDLQKLDGQIVKIKLDIAMSPKQKKLQELNNYMREGKSYVEKLNNYASTLVENYNQLDAIYQNLLAKSQIVEKSKVDTLAEEQLGSAITDSNYLVSELSKVEQSLKNISDNMSQLMQDYQSTINKVRSAKEQIAVVKQDVAAIEGTYEPEIAELESKIKNMETDINSKILTLYKKMRSDNLFPVFVHLSEDNRCGGCHMELSLNFINNLKTSDMLQCEECHRYILPL